MVFGSSIGTCLKQLYQEPAREHPEPPQLAPLDSEEQQLHNEVILGCQGPQSITESKPSYPVEEAHFHYLYS